MALVVDAHPETRYRLDALPWRTRIQIYDAPFGLRKGDSFFLHFNGEKNWVRGENGVPAFNDMKEYFDPELPNHGVKLPKAGVKIQVISETSTGSKIVVPAARYVTIWCDGKERGIDGQMHDCNTEGVFGDRADFAREEAQQAGWLVSLPGARDLCPRHKDQRDATTRWGES